jgi:hypothetical protein
MIESSPNYATGMARQALAGLGMTLRTLVDGQPIPDADLIWLQANPRWYPGTLGRLAAMPAEQRPRSLFWHTEGLPMPRASGLPKQRLHSREVAGILLRRQRISDTWTNPRMIRQLARSLPDTLLVVSARASQDYLAEHGIASEFVPLGAAGEPIDLGLERDVEVLFLGAPDVPRRRALVSLLRARGIGVQAVGAFAGGGVWGDERARLLSRTKILLNLSRRPGQYSGFRLLLGFTYGCLVISEPMYQPEPFVPGEHFVSVPAAEMPETISYYLAHPDEAAAIVKRARQQVRSGVTMAHSVRRILDLAEQRLAPR